MKLALSTSAAPDFTLAELFDTCARRGLAALELVADDRHGVGPELEHREVLEITAEAAAREIGIAAYRSRGLWEAAAPCPAGIGCVMRRRGNWRWIGPGRYD